jgi:hypothetical protein
VVICGTRANQVRWWSFSAKPRREADGRFGGWRGVVSDVTDSHLANQRLEWLAHNDTLTGLVEKLETRFGIEVPLSDLFVWGTPAAPLDKINSAMNAGQDFIGDDLCDHYAFRQGNVDWQIWITTGARPLPRKVVITNRSDEARPQSVSLIAWNLNPGFNDSVFRFVPPKGATQAQIVAPKTK